MARLFPPQGSWSEEEYLDLRGNRLIELDDGRVEVLGMPSELHQFLVLFLYEALVAYVRPRNLGWVVVAPMPVRLWEHKLREPDVLFMRREHAARRRGTYWIGADLVMEVMSPDDPKRDKDTKRQEYARAGIPEYWLVDVVEGTVTVFCLRAAAEQYAVHGVFRVGERAESPALVGFGIEVQELFAAGDL
ncbi:MAG: Uma2 family endonuclease [Pseudomonadota bacterium]|nr:Uma2 family endonuclease [Gammaproteobacteria bacterium]MDQ3583990.1 Uma2 family endonuclease [Pseudomonadota bacterium]